MSACPIFDRITMINTNPDIVPKRTLLASSNTSSTSSNNGNISDPLDSGGGGGTGTGGLVTGSTLERDYYGCYCLKFIVKNGTHITEDKVLEDFGHYGDVVDVRGPGLFSGLRGNHVYVRFVDKADAEAASRNLSSKYHQLTPASISDVLPDNYGLYTISFYNKTGIPSSEVRREFSKFGEVKNLTGSLDVKGGRVFVSYKEKNSAVQALQAFFFRKDRYPNMKFALPRCEKDYFGCYCLKFYNKSGDVTEEKVQKDFGQFGDVVDVRGPGLFDVTGDDVYVRYKDKSSAEQALIELVGKYDSLCLAPPSDIQADKFGYFTITFVNDKCLSKSDVWYIFSKFGTVACVNGTFDCKKGRVFVSYKDKQGALNALETMLITKEYHLQVSKNSTVRKNDYNMIIRDDDISGVGPGGGAASSNNEVTNSTSSTTNTAASTSSNITPKSKESRHSTPPRDHSRGRSSGEMSATSSTSSSQQQKQQMLQSVPPQQQQQQQQQQQPPPLQDFLSVFDAGKILHQPKGSGNGIVKFNRNVEKDIFGYYCLSFLNEDGDINEKKVRHDFGKFGEVVSVRGALGKQKGHVFVRFLRKESAENCLNCLNSFPLSEMSELFGKYLFLSPATPRDIDCDMYGLYSISFLNLNNKSARDINAEFSKFGEVLRLTSGGGGNTDELVSISYADKASAVKALQTHFTNKEFPYLDIAKGSSLLLVNSSGSSDNEDENESEYIYNQVYRRRDPFHDPSPTKNGQGDVVDELLKPFQSYFSIYRTGQYSSPLGGFSGAAAAAAAESSAQPSTPSQATASASAVALSSSSSVTASPPPSTASTTNATTTTSSSSSSPPSSTTTNSTPQQVTQSAINRSPDKRYRIKKSKESTKNGFVNGTKSSVVATAAAGETEMNGWANHSDTATTTTTTSTTETTTSPSTTAATPKMTPIESTDMFGYYSLSFSLSRCTHPKEYLRDDKKLRAEFGGKMERIRHCANDVIVVSFTELELAVSSLNSTVLKSKFPDLRPTGSFRIVPDRDGFYSIEFVNSGMNGIREITNEFSKHGKVKKVQQGGAKNAVKRITVSYSEEKSAISAVAAYGNSKDFLAVDFARECLIEEEGGQENNPGLLEVH